MRFLKIRLSNSLKAFVYIAKQRPKKSAVCIGDPNEIGLFALLSAPLRPRSAQASPAYSRLPLVLVKLVSTSSNQIKITIKKTLHKGEFF